MICVNCGVEAEGRICKVCENDVLMTAKLYSFAVTYYNKGLQLAKEGKYSLAMHNLRKSVCFRKNCPEALNLLGLVYHRIGRISEAAICWRYSLKIDSSKNNPAFNYVNDIRKSEAEKKKFASVKSYNKALSHAKNGNCDLAVVALKRAIELNGYFVDAHNLLALCYVQRNDLSSALRHVKFVLKVDKENEIATDYLKRLKPEKFKSFELREPEIKEKKIKSTKAENVIRSNTGRITGFFLGALFAGLVCTCLVVPELVNRYKTQYDNLSLQRTIEINSKDTQIANDVREIQRLSKENESLSSRLYTSGEQELEQRLKTLNDIRTTLDSGNAVVAGDMLIALSVNGFSQSALDTYNSYRKTVLPMAAKSCFELGNKAEDRGDYEGAKTYYQKCGNFCMGNEEVKFSSEFRLAKILQNEGDYEQAATLFNDVAQNHPNEEIKNEAKEYISEKVEAE